MQKSIRIISQRPWLETLWTLILLKQLCESNFVSWIFLLFIVLWKIMAGTAERIIKIHGCGNSLPSSNEIRISTRMNVKNLLQYFSQNVIKVMNQIDNFWILFNEFEKHAATFVIIACRYVLALFYKCLTNPVGCFLNEAKYSKIKD